MESDTIAALVRRLRESGSPYWREKLRDAGETLAELPFTTKSELRDTYPFALLLAERAQELGTRVSLRYGVFGAEPWSEAMREKLEQAWGGIDACDIYGLSEVIGPGVAMECREGKGAMHVFDDHFFPEIVDPATGESTEGLGELVL